MLHITTTAGLGKVKNGDVVKVAGLVLVRQRPGTAKGVCFMTIEDETGYANLVIFQNIFDRYRKLILQSKLIMAEGKLQQEGDVIHVIVSRCHDFSKLLRHLTPSQNENIPVQTLSRADERAPLPVHNKPGNQDHDNSRVIPGARSFR
jgi:error-prone DNA polymerase